MPVLFIAPDGELLRLKLRLRQQGCSCLRWKWCASHSAHWVMLEKREEVAAIIEDWVERYL